MKRNEEDEIQVLGGSSIQKKNRFRTWSIIAGVAVAILLLLGAVWLLTSKSNPATNFQKKGEETQVRPVPEKIIPDSTTTSVNQLIIVRDSINDVPLTIYSLANLKAELTIGWPQDDDFRFATQAADVRKDNQEILGDYVIRGQQITKGKRKTGYVAIVDGNVSLGISLDDEIKDLCVQNKGDFFRQYALVIDGEIQENQLKGKALRRAIAQQGTDIFIIESCQRESLYDFSEAIADLGVTNAIYLVGGDAYGAYRDEKNQLHAFGSPNRKEHPYVNFIVFRQK